MLARDDLFACGRKLSQRQPRRIREHVFPEKFPTLRGVGGRRPDLKQCVVNVGNECSRFHCQFVKSSARPEASQSPTASGMVHRLPMSPAALPLTLTLSLRERGNKLSTRVELPTGRSPHRHRTVRSDLTSSRITWRLWRSLTGLTFV